MGRQNSNNQIEKFIGEFNKHVYHPILNRDIGQPKLKKETAFFLLLPKLNGEEWTSSTNTAAIALGAVYTAFAAHDAVNSYDVTTTNEQLRVLSGDYLSGIYYQLIAALPNFEFIQAIAEIISRINEAKIELYTNINMKPNDRIQAIQTIQAECIAQFLISFGYEKYSPIVNAALPLMTLLQQERTADGWSLKEDIATGMIDQLIDELEKEITKSDFLLPHIAGEVKEMALSCLGKTT